MSSFMTASDVAQRLGVKEWKVRRLFERKLLPDPPRVGRYRAFREGDLPAIKAALKKHRYLK